MAELDFRDMYWQLKFYTETMRQKKQMEYLCIRTVGGTLAYSRGPNGLLGMDAICEELTDKLFGDLVLEGKVAKIADNIYCGGETIRELHMIFETIMERCSKQIYELIHRSYNSMWQMQIYWDYTGIKES